jgi:hypothetical protein
MGPQQFDLWVGETFQTNDPASPVTGIDISATVGVTIDWNLGGSELTNKGVEFSAPQWAGPGNGPFTIYNPVSSIPPPIGRVSWSIETHVLKKMETDTPQNRYRWAVTPVVQLIRQVTMTDGSPSTTGVINTASNTVRGGWIQSR